ncbi:hypothetical protein H0H92_014680 [Tricholoma furcatifolium]|nr:hypothetical protein H0H92_014680 [Tricholoma furcatifolium]
MIRQFDNSKHEEAEIDLQQYLEQMNEAELEEDNEEEEGEEEEEEEEEDLELDADEDEGNVQPVRMVLNKINDQLRKISFAVKNSSTLILPEWYKVLERLNLSARMLPRDVRTRWNSTYEMLT